MYTTAIHCGGHAGYEIAPFVPSLQGLCSLLLTRGKVNEYVVVVVVVVVVGWVRDGERRDGWADGRVSTGWRVSGWGKEQTQLTPPLPPHRRYLTTVEHHDLHHQLYTIHFGLYFQVWDRLMGTNQDSSGKGERGKGRRKKRVV